MAPFYSLELEPVPKVNQGYDIDQSDSVMMLVTQEKQQMFDCQDSLPFKDYLGQTREIEWGWPPARKIEKKQRFEQFSVRKMFFQIREGRPINMPLVVSLFYETAQTEFVISESLLQRLLKAGFSNGWLHPPPQYPIESH
jgi:hypothetical protein